MTYAAASFISHSPHLRHFNASSARASSTLRLNAAGSRSAVTARKSISAVISPASCLRAPPMPRSRHHGIPFLSRSPLRYARTISVPQSGVAIGNIRPNLFCTEQVPKTHIEWQGPQGFKMGNRFVNHAFSLPALRRNTYSVLVTCAGHSQPSGQPAHALQWASKIFAAVALAYCTARSYLRYLRELKA